MNVDRHAAPRRCTYDVALAIAALVGGFILLFGLILLLLADRPVTHSFHFNRIWAYQFAEQFGSGQLYPRWLEQSFGGLGSPSFVFYPPLAFYASLPLVLFDATMSESLNGSMALAALVFGAGIYIAVSRGAGPRDRAPAPIAFIAAAMGMTSPYLLENIFVRGSLGEVWAMAFIPWLMYGLGKMLTDYRDWWIVSLAMAAIAFSHPAVFLMIAVCAPFVALAMKAITCTSWRVLSALLSAFLLGGLLAAVYLLPAFCERDLVLMNEFMFDGELNPLNRFLWTLDGSVHLTEHPYDRHLLPVLLLNALILAVGAYCCSIKLGTCRHEAYTLVFLAVVVFMVSSAATWVYRELPMLQAIQFSFRWLAVGSGVLPVIWGRLLRDCRGRRRARLVREILIGLLFFSVAASIATYSRITWGDSEALRKVVETRSAQPAALQLDSFLKDFDSWFETRPSFPAEVDKSQPLLLSDVVHVTTSRQLFFDDAPEYLPKTATDVEHIAHVNFPLVEWRSGKGRLSVVEWRYGRRQLDIAAEEQGEVVLRGFHWPGWQARLNDQPVEVQPGNDGRQVLGVPVGNSRIVLEYTGSQSERTGALVSAAVLLFFILFFLVRVVPSEVQHAVFGYRAGSPSARRT